MMKILLISLGFQQQNHQRELILIAVVVKIVYVMIQHHVKIVDVVVIVLK